MSFVRPARRVLIATVSVSALLLAAACGGGGGDSEPGTGGGGGGEEGADFTEKGPITYAQGKDTSGQLPELIAAWNKDHADEQVKFVELPDSADQQRSAMIQNAQVKSDAYTVLSVDVVWTAEFAANQYVDALPEDQLDTSNMLEATVNSAKYFDKLYAFPNTSDGGMLYYRKDLLDEAGLEPPQTWDEMKAACEKITSDSKNKSMDCYAGQHDKYEGLTVNFAEAINGAGGNIIDDQGKVVINDPKAVEGLSFLADSFKDGTIPKEAITWKEEEGRQAFQDGTLIFLRNWPYVYSLASKDDGSSKIVGKFAVAPLPGKDGPGVSSLGGHNMAISKFGKNKGTAVEFIKYMSSEEIQKSRLEETSAAPTIASLYDDPELIKEFPYLDTLKKSIETANPRPKAVKYGDVTLAIQDAAYGAQQGSVAPDAALTKLQTDLEGLVQ